MSTRNGRPDRGGHSNTEPRETTTGSTSYRTDDTTRRTGEVRNVIGSHRVGDRPTAVAAGHRNDRQDLTVRRLVEREVAKAGARGLIDDELQAANPSRHPGSLSKRRGELVDDGRVVDSGRTRLTRSRRSAVVWVMKEHAQVISK